MSEVVDQLIAILLDPGATISERDDAAMDLGDHDSAFDVLVRVASAPNEDELVQAACGTSIAEIWHRSGRYDDELVASLAKTAQGEIRAAFRKD